MVPSLPESLSLAHLFAERIRPDERVEVTVHPPFTFIQAVGEVLKGKGIGLGGQDVYWEEKGAYTGQVAPRMLKEIGCTCVIIGHSERRGYFGETDESVSKKALAAARVGLTPIVCVGETLEEREKGRTLERVKSQVESGLAGMAQMQGEPAFAVAYEPVWAIGTGKTPKPEEAQEVHALIRRTLAGLIGARSEAIRIQYGGSVTAENAAVMLGRPDIDGALVGGASLKPDAFIAIIEAARNKT